MSCNTSEINSRFGAHNVTIYNPETGQPYKYGMLKVMGDVAWSNNIENVPLNGGSNPYAWEVGNGAASSEVTFTVRQFEPSMEQYMGGAVFTETAASTNGTISTPVNMEGTSVVNASTGIASLTLEDVDDLKAGDYIIKATAASTVSIYATTDIDFNRGTDIEFEDKETLLVKSGITVSGTGGTTDVAEIGVTITGGSGSVSLTTNDTAGFSVATPHDKIYDFQYGVNGEYPEYVGLVFVSDKQPNGSYDRLVLPKVKCNGLNFALAEKNYAETEITGVAIRAKSPFTGDCVVGETRHVRGENA